MNTNSNQIEEDTLSSEIISLMKQSEICHTSYKAYLVANMGKQILSFEEYANQCWKQYRKII